METLDWPSWSAIWRAVWPASSGAAAGGGVAEAAEGVAEDRVVEADAGGVPGAEHGDGPVGQAEHALSGSRLGYLAEEAFAGDACDGVGDLGGPSFEVDLVPEHC